MEGRTHSTHVPRAAKRISTARRRPAAHSVAVIIDAVIRSLYHIHVRGLEHHTRSPSTLVVTNHQRDADGPIIASVLFDRHGLVPHGVLPWFVAREDLFRRGFLADYLEGWPAPLREPMHWLRLDWFLRLVQALPMRRIPERSLYEVLEDVLEVCGDLPLDEVLRPAWLRRFQALAGARGGPLRVADVLRGRRYRDLLAREHGLRRLRRECFRALRPWQQAAIDAQLAHFTSLLEGGETVLLAPEGTISPDGCFHEMRNALPALVKRPGCPARVLPVDITHDFMSAGRKHVFVNLGPELTDLRECRRRDLCRRVARAVQSLSTVTATQLASDFLIRVRERGEAVVDVQSLRAHVGAQAERFAGAGARVDERLLHPESLAVRIECYLEYCTGIGMLDPQAEGRYGLRDVDRRPPSGWRNRERPLRFAGNQFADVDGIWRRRRKAL